MNWEIRIDICTLPCVKQWKAAIEHRELSLVLGGDLGLGWGEGSSRGRGYMYIYMADSLHCITETSTTL